MQRGRLMVRILAFAALAALAAIVLIIVAGPAGATWTGEPLPGFGGDWYIDEDTWYEDEVIDLYGSIYVDYGVYVELSGCAVTFYNDWDDQHGIEVWWGELDFTSSASGPTIVQSDESWYGYRMSWY